MLTKIAHCFLVDYEYPLQFFNKVKIEVNVNNSSKINAYTCLCNSNVNTHRCNLQLSTIHVELVFTLKGFHTPFHWAVN